MTKYRIEGIDCPVCAQGLESELKKLEGVREIVVDFATSTLHVDALDIAAVEAEAKRLEPGIGLLKIGADRAGTKPLARAADLAAIGTAACLGVAAALAVAWVPAISRLPPILRAIPFIAAWLVAGYPVLRGAFVNILRGRVFDELFLMSIATLGAIAIGAWEEAVGVMVFYRVGELFQDLAIRRARASIRGLIDRKPATARRRHHEGWKMVPASEVAVGDLLLVLPGELVPVDGRVESGNASIDTRTLSGESAPRDVGPGAEVYGGSFAIDGSLEIQARSTLANSKVARIADLVEEASARKAKAERFVTRFAAWYTPIVVALAALTALVPPLFVPGSRLSDWVYRALVMLVISCPCALVLSIPLGYFAGLGGAARRGILVRGGEIVDALARADAIVFDKTGTLTMGAFEVLGIEAAGGRGADEVLEVAALVETRSRHPIAKAILREEERRAISAGIPDIGIIPGTDSVKDFREYPGRGIVARVGGRVTLVGNEAFLAESGVRTADRGAFGAGGFASDADSMAATAVLVAQDGVAIGRILVGDRVGAETPDAIAKLRALGVGTMAMLTGDGKGPATAAARELGIGEWHDSLDPEGKLRELEAFMGRKSRDREAAGATIFVGDGTNDAPVLARADVGIAMGDGSDAAIGTADVVLAAGGLGSIPEAIRLARRTRGIVRQNVVLALGVKSAFLALGAAGIAGMWLAVFADVGVAILAVLNAGRGIAAGRVGLPSRGGSRHN